MKKRTSDLLLGLYVIILFFFFGYIPLLLEGATKYQGMVGYGITLIIFILFLMKGDLSDIKEGN
jgi:hypothetical protein